MLSDSLRRFGHLILLVFALMPFASARNRDRGFVDRTVTVDGTEYRYQVYLPWDWSKQKKWPIILFLHGAGERGNDGLRQTQVGIGRALRLDADRFPFIVVMPQCRKGLWWTEPRMEEQALKALDAATREFHADADRTYLTGISMGGYGTWDLAAKRPRKFAAVVPICGGVHVTADSRGTGAKGQNVYVQIAKNIGNTPVWAFHGADDDVVPVSESRVIVDALKSVGGNVKYTEYPGVKHNSWDKAYSEPDLPKWLLSHRLEQPSGDDKHVQ